MIVWGNLVFYFLSTILSKSNLKHRKKKGVHNLKWACANLITVGKIITIFSKEPYGTVIISDANQMFV